MSTPVTHRIADKAPEFPCWLWDKISKKWLLMLGGCPLYWYTSSGMEYWCHSAERPTHAPESQAPSDSEMLDYLDGLTIEQAVAVINSQSKNLPTVRAAIASAMKGGDK